MQKPQLDELFVVTSCRFIGDMLIGQFISPYIYSGVKTDFKTLQFLKGMEC
jgi:hypothetical protein